MKQISFFKNMAAIMLLAAGAASCSNENALIDDNKSQQPEAQPQIITVNFGGKGQTKALDADGHKTITVGEYISVLYNWNPSNQYIPADYFLRVAEAEVIAVDGTGKIATLSVTLPGVYNDDSFALIYPSGFYSSTTQKWLYNNADLMNNKLGTHQDGTLETLSSSFDYCKAEGNIVNGQLPSNITMENQLCICKFTLQDNSNSSDITTSTTSFLVSDGTNSYTINRSATAGPIYVAMLPVATAAFSFTASDGVNIYKKNITSATLQAGYIYNSTLSMTKQVSNVGKVLGADGNIYATVAEATAASTTAAGMIAYEGIQTGVDGKTNGLCISLIEGAAEKQLYANISYAGFPARPAGASDWATPSVMQWMRMLEACGGSSIGSKTESSTGPFSSGNIASMMTTCGGTEFHTTSSSGEPYWTTYGYDSGGLYTRNFYNFKAQGFYQHYQDGDTKTCWYRGVFAW
ncbi:MAG: hypothetical protein IK006_02420 [Bacteroidaceae bacterium]|nr:hypothetical protein [Bacteroidaceae bacterium]